MPKEWSLLTNQRIVHKLITYLKCPSLNLAFQKCFHDLEGCDGGEEREAQEGGDICKIMADLSSAVWQKPTQHYKAIFLQLKSKLNTI